MKKAKYTWQLREKTELPEEFSTILTNEQINPLLGQILWHRGIQSKEALEIFLRPTVENLYDPFLMHDMEKTVARIQDAVTQGEKILVYGDYDADGITSTTVMKEAIELIGGEVEYFLPNRFIHGYGPNLTVFKEQIENGVQLIITVDNGVAGHEAINYATEQGIDVIVTDHHELPPELPNAFSLIHPKHPQGHYPFGELAGVGVAFKVATALLGELPVEFLDLVAIGTIADLVSLTDENRVLVKMGLEMIQNGERIGLDILIHLAELKKETISEENIGFTIAPRLNALGRLGDATPGVELMTTFDEEEAERIATYINSQNDERKEIVAKITKEAFELIDPTDPIHIVAKKGWHEGVLGIVAGRIMQDTGKPTIVLTIDENNEYAKGSGRSVSALNLFDSLSEIREEFTHFGGHHMAAGMTLPVDHINKVKQHLMQYLETNQIDLSQGQELLIDESLKVEEATIPFIQQLKILAPLGTDNPVPNFLFEDVAVEQSRQIGADKSHLKFQIGQGGAKLDAIAFQMGNQVDEFGQGTTNITGQLSINEWNGNKKPQLMVSDFSVDGVQLFDLRGKNARQKEIPEANTLYVYFNADSKKIIDNQSSHQHFFNSVAETVQTIEETNSQQLVFVDCPDDIDLLKQITQAGKIERVYIMAISQEEAYLNGTGSREQYAQLYKFVRQQEQVDVRYKLNVVAQHLKIQEKLLIFMIQVFFDLGFVTIENGVLRKVESPENHPLTESKVYQTRLKRIKTEEFLLYSDRETLQQWLWNEEEV
ncbi:single-stranded-DNA-specific exonuclease RecJ [Enterococcus haemoperoxidus ATCC BAA-382]|uniref:Single-stranded-DNA-specific exonuclease RecJ n=1 Tax=Enterococcus haemoperoxidus ATCC BAA-382 TaxID=1158608 RepID=R2STH6_9ENTE|nr:single-stranded-DNA-specific exonuclease RecJ [Enterococcus haemoperoxidus]EOH98535.1 single-stranded-DNA-specific exonuclease RecJ [Enterococcus haemoperoxidus ATCC BAA-382]EOT62282.1 single-stranded-DNA-specific exonuclease RecJ [Enterococcus haemoperoxidus ATCC BAA-382]OJG55635.1 single-stranded-DNA-specific exonuclease RecJ [Enterococcus haemoperoxidus]